MIATLLYFRIDTLLLTFLGYGSTEVGWYNASYNIFAVLLLPAIAFSQAAFPSFVRLYVNKKSEFKKYYIYSVVFLLLVGIGIGVVVYVAAPALIRILYGGNYEYSVSVLRVLAVAICFSLVTWFSQRLFIAVGKIKELLLFMVGAAIFNIVLNIQCIPVLGAVGAAMTTMLCEVLFALYAIYYIIAHIVRDDTTSQAAV
jgi:O-antigen/teichoic acid export membrane protein